MSAARSEFPLRLGGQRLARPFGISLCVLERDVDDGVVHQIVDAAVRARRVPPVGAGHQCPPLTEIVERHRRGGALENERGDRKSVVEGKSVSVRLDLGGRRLIKKTKKKQ